MLKLLITGGCGFIGSNLVNTYGHLYDMVILDNLSSGKIKNIKTQAPVKIIRGDITDEKIMKRVFQEHAFDGVIHLAAVSSVHECQKFPLQCSQVNLMASLQLLERCIQHNVKKFIFASSAAVYGNQLDFPKDEETSLPAPTSFYGVHKFAVEKTLMVYSQQSQIQGVAFRFFNVYGPNQDPRSPYSGVLSIFMEKFLEHYLPEVSVYGTGEQTRDFIHVSDVIEGIMMSINEPRMNGQVYNLGTGRESSLLEVLSCLKEISGKKVKVHFLPSRGGDIQRSLSSNKKILDLGFKIKVSLKEGLRKLYFNQLSSLESLDLRKDNAIMLSQSIL